MIEIDIHKQLNGPSGMMPLNFKCTLDSKCFSAIFGPSGSGKTSILRMLTGLMKPDKGRIIVEGETWVDTEKEVYSRPQNRNVGIVFQDYGLFPNMTVRKNIQFALKKGQNPKIVDELIEIMSLNSLADQRPDVLSGGQQQRVALARTLVRKPDLLLLDEPLAAIDMEMRENLQDHIRNIHQQYNLTTILVSHSLKEVMKLAEVIYYLKEGRVIKEGKPIEVFNIANTRDYNFIDVPVIEVIEENGQTFAIVLVNGKIHQLLVRNSIPQIGQTIKVSIVD